MSVQNPSYLLKSRHWIWYFQIQIPKKFRTSQKRQLFKKSLRTTNRLLALKKSRLWWLKIEENDFRWEDESENLNEQYHRGKLIYQQLNKLDSNDTDEIHKFINSLSIDEENSLKFYNDKLEHQTLHITSQSTNKIQSFLLSELTEKFISEKKINWGDKQKESNEHKDYRPKIFLFIEIIGNKQGSQLTKQDVIKYKESLFKIPRNKSKVKLHEFNFEVQFCYSCSPPNIIAKKFRM